MKLFRPIALAAILATTFALPACESGGAKTDPSQPSPPPGANNAEDLAAVRETWARYERALETRDGATVVATLTENSYPYYANLLHVALDGSRAEVEALPLPAKWEVLNMRQRCTRSQLASMDAKQYVAFATDEGWYVGNDATPFEKLTSGANRAVGVVKHPSESKTYQFIFRRVNGRWLFDEPSCHGYYADLYDAAARAEGVPPTQHILGMIAEESGQPIRAGIWDPMPQ